MEVFVVNNSSCAFWLHLWCHWICEEAAFPLPQAKALKSIFVSYSVEGNKVFTGYYEGRHMSKAPGLYSGMAHQPNAGSFIAFFQTIAFRLNIHPLAASLCLSRRRVWVRHCLTLRLRQALNQFGFPPSFLPAAFLLSRQSHWSLLK